MSTDIKSVVVSNIHDVDYCYIMAGITKSEAINLSTNGNLSEESGSL